MTTISVLGENVHYYRRKARYTQAHLAKKVGVSPMTISRLETGQIEDLKAQTVHKIAQNLGVYMDNLMDHAVRG